MKRKICILAMIVVFAMTLAACQPQEAAEANESPAVEQVPDESDDGQEEKAPMPSYKDTMLPFDQLVAGDRIVILQNTLNYSREGFYTEDQRPESCEIAYQGQTLEAYPITYALNFLNEDLSGTVTIINRDGSSLEMAAEDFAALFVIIDFTSPDAPVLTNPESGIEITDMLYALTDKGEALYSVVSGSTYNAAALISSVGWDPDETDYRYMATDRFYITVTPAENETGEVRGTLSGAVNGSFPDLKVASGKINDVIYIEIPGQGGQ